MTIAGSTLWKEHVAPDEAAQLERHATALRAMQRRHAGQGSAARGLHAKSHTGAVGELIVSADLPESLRVAVFAEPRTWPVYVRFSSGSGKRKPGPVRDVRGIALKLVGVPGKKLIPGLEDRRTQDFLFISNDTFPVRSPAQFFALASAAHGSPALLLPRLVAALGFGIFGVIKRVGASPHLATMVGGSFNTALPLRFGPTAAKLALVPESVDTTLRAGAGPDALREDLRARLASGPLAWSLRAQLFVDEQVTPIEDATVSWPEDRSPFHELARLVLPQQDLVGARGVKIEQYVEQLSFDPWHAVEELRPLGAMMRARAVAYRESVIERKAAPEPEDMVI